MRETVLQQMADLRARLRAAGAVLSVGDILSGRDEGRRRSRVAGPALCLRNRAHRVVWIVPVN